MKIRCLTLIIVLSMVFMPIALAQDDIWNMAQSDRYGTKVGGMLGRGLVNASTCFVDLIVQTVDGTKKGPPLVGTLTGLGGGIGCTALRATSGVLDVATFWVPGFNGIPVSKSYSNCLICDAEAPAPATAVYSAPVPTPQPSPTIVSTPPPAPRPEPVKERNVNRYVSK